LVFLGYGCCFMLPYVITPEEIDFLAKVAREGIDRAVA
jgi:adenosylmethionine-8-amino-7-oxononanoate aminotransferase